ncbi:cytochrome b5-like heme/steroid binding domain-containing protein [Infundibulicybe gibba]|nr:cytochrome b5-like heme/steroid binding domain-containing protein [Infundibulicybe gibba]
MGLFDLGTPVNTALFLYILYSVQRIVFPSVSKPKSIPNEFKAGYSWMPSSHPPTPFDGKDGGRIMLAINGTVFDVTAGRNFYGPDGMYGNFAGRDASGEWRNIIRRWYAYPVDQPLDKLTDLKPDEIDNMIGWIEHFSNKYIVCGKLVENDAI